MKRWREIWAKWHKSLRRRLRENLTWTGFFFSVALALISVAAFLSANNLLFLILAAMIATLMVADFLSRLSMSGLEFEVALPDHICARTPTPARVALHNEKRWMPSFSVHVMGLEDSLLETALYFPVIPRGARVEETVNVRFTRRGLHKEDSFLFSSRFPFGFSERRVRATMERPVVVYPSLEAQPGFDDLFTGLRGEMEARLRGRGSDFYRIRPYVNGESARHVDWRATAHTGELQVREFARDQEFLITVVLDLEWPDGRAAEFERAIECAAYVTARQAQRGGRLRFRTADFDCVLPREADLYTVLRYLALVERRGGRLPSPDPNEDSLPLILTPFPQRAEAAGWMDARVLGSDVRLRANPENR